MNILFHICCSNCALYPVKIVREEGHDFTGFWFNPNIQPYEEYELRLNSLKGLSERLRIEMIYNEDSNQNPTLTPFDVSVSHSSKGEIKERCKSCYMLRLRKTAEEAQIQGFDAFSTTLLISPYQDFQQIVSIGSELAGRYNVLFYLKDFRQYFREAMALARKIGLYRQKYCGCIPSREERFNKIQNSTLNHVQGKCKL